jgi:predicted outer membrane protein
VHYFDGLVTGYRVKRLKSEGCEALFLRALTHMRSPGLHGLLLVAVLIACGREEKPTQARRGPARQDSTPASQGISDPQAVQILEAIDRARLIGARAVGQKSANEAVLEYARVMMADHGAITRALDSVLTAAGQKVGDHPLSMQLHFSAEQFASDIAVRDTGINNSYLAREVADHERALQLITGAFLPNAKNPQLKNTLEQIVPAYHAHLQRARAIQAERRTAVAGRPVRAAPREPLLGRPRRDTIR